MKILADNKNAYYNYEILDKYEAGMVLTGSEVKSIKTGHVGIKGSYVVLKGEEAYLVGANIPPYQPKNAPKDYDAERSRKLLLKKSEIKELLGKSKEKGLALIPLQIYAKHARIKLAFGVGKGKRKTDKRESIKKRETEREIERELKTRG
jgi:SsrA-binding protein